MAEVKISFGKPILVQRADSTIEIAGPNGKGKIGKLVFSQGSVEWFPKGRSVNVRQYSWEELAALLGENGRPHKVAAKKKAKA